MESKGYAALASGSKLEPYTFTRRELRPHDVGLEIYYGGICHSDIHQVREEWGASLFPMVPGHEIVRACRNRSEAVSRSLKLEI
jgi:uncharacterized zinc-type alcohol dehydrogenase-like protein